ncbi:MAG TPA: hypothetical protein VF469_19320 [Kofleriaceae bacterium]
MAWELGIKLARERLTLPEPLDDYVMSRAQRARMSLLPIDLVHVLDRIGKLLRRQLRGDHRMLQ